MRKQPIYLTIFLLIAVLLAACTPAAATKTMMDEQPTEAMMEYTPTSDMMDKPDTMMDATTTPEMMDDHSKDDMMSTTGTPEMMDDHSDDMSMDKTGTPAGDMMDDDQEMMAPDWFSAEFTDAVSGETFKVSDFAGKVVLVETFAQWCPTCLKQLGEVQKLHEAMGMNEDLVTVALDIDPNEDQSMLQSYLDQHGFDWHFAIASTDAAREIGDLYGAQFLNPPSTPMLVIDRHGEAHPLPFGLKSVDDLQKALEPFLNDTM